MRSKIIILYLNFWLFFHFYSFIIRIVNDHSFKSSAEVMSEVHKDKAMSPLESAVYWIEYTIRTRGAKHLRPAAHDLYWYQYLMLDSIALIMATLVFLYKAIPFLYKLLFKYRISISRNELKFYRVKF